MAVRKAETGQQKALTHRHKWAKPASQKADQPGKTVAPRRHSARLREKEGESERGLSASDILLPHHFSQFSFQRLHHTPPSSLRATVHTARPNKGQVPAFLLRAVFASHRQTASQGLFKGPANPIRLLICEALSPQTPASAGSTSQSITRLLVVIGGDRKSEGSRHHKASMQLGVSQEWQSETREGLSNTSHVMTAAPGTTQLHIGCEIWIRPLGFHLYLLLSTAQRKCVAYEQYMNKIN